MKKIVTACCLLFFVYCANAQNQGANFTNPLLTSGADPWTIYKDGYYYYTNSTGHNLMIWKTRNMAELTTAERKVVWTPPAGMPYSKELWAPELHFFRGKWYMYFAADGGQNKGHRIYAIENASADPLQGDWVFKGQVSDASNKWAIDASAFELNSQLYMMWSGWEGDENGQQNIYIAKMKDPYTISGERVMLSNPVYPWETFGNLNDANNPPHVSVNEGPEILMHGNKIFLIYSASGCWTDHYALGMLSASINSDLLDPKSWQKSPKPVFSTNRDSSVYAPGHNAFFKSPDGRQDWIIYHANPAPGCGCDGQRSPRIQQFTWKKDSTPNFGFPVKTGTVLKVPSKVHQHNFSCY